MICKKCGHLMEDDHVYCTECGWQAGPELGPESSIDQETGETAGKMNFFLKNRKKLIAAVLAILLFGGGGGTFFLIRHGQEVQKQAEAEKQKEIADARKKEEEAAEKKKQEELKQQEALKKQEEEKKAKEEEKWNKVLADWKESQTIENLKALLDYREEKSEAMPAAQEWYDGLWDNPVQNLGMLIPAADLMGQDQEMKPVLEACRPILEAYGTDPVYDNDVIFEGLDNLDPRSNNSTQARSRIQARLHLSREGLTCSIIPIDVPHTYGMPNLHQDPEKASEQGLAEVQFFEETDHLPVTIENGKLSVTARIMRTHQGLQKNPMTISFDKDQMTCSHESDQWVLYPLTEANKDCLHRYMEWFEQNNGKIYQQIEYCVMDLNHDGQMDILIRDSYSKPEYKFHPSVQFFLRSPDRFSVFDAGSVLEWSSSIESDGTDLYHYHFHQGVYRLEKADFSSGEAKFTEIDAQDWNDKPGQPDPGYENQLYWMHYSFGQ